MKKFDSNYTLLEGMYRDGYFQDFLVDKVKDCNSSGSPCTPCCAGMYESVN